MPPKTPPPASAVVQKPRERGLLLLVAGLILFALVVYHQVLSPGRLLFTTDDGVGAIALRKASFPHSFLGGWDDTALVGQPMMINLNWTNIILHLLPAETFVNWIHAIDLTAGSIFLALFLRLRGLRLPAIALGVLAAFWFGSNFFLTYAGHIGKFGVLVFAPFFLWQAECAVQRRSWAHAVLAGGGMGAMFLEQADSALFFSMALGCFLLHRIWTSGADRIRTGLKLLPPVLAVAGLIAIHPVLTAKSLFLTDAPESSTANSKSQQWDYSTQWSWPPEETIEWIAPGYYGWRSGEPDGPYWGRLGCQPGTENQKAAGNNFKLENFYIGSIPVALALLAIALGIAARGSTALPRGEIIFWTAALLATFILGLGKYSPVYRAFFELPGISSIRAPVKFIQVTQLVLAILAAVGLDALLRITSPGAAGKAFVNFRRIVLGLGILLLVVGFATAAGEQSRIQELMTRGWGPYSNTIVNLQTTALIRAAIMMLLAWGLMMLLPRTAARARIAWIAIVLVAADQLTVSHHYVSTVNAAGVIGANQVTEELKTTRGGQRAYLLMNESRNHPQLQAAAATYNHWLTYLFPYHNISAFNVTQIRMPEDYQRFLTALGPTPDRLWRLCAVGPLIYPTPFGQQLQNLPAIKNAVQPLFTFNVDHQGVETRYYPATTTQPGLHTFARLNTPAPRYALLAGWQKADDATTLAALASQPLFEKAYIPTNAPAPEAGTATGITGTVTVKEYRTGRAVLQTQSDQPAILRASDKFMPHWKATIDGQPAPLFRCDYLFQGLHVPAGQHEIVLHYSPPMTTLWAQLAGTALCAIALLWLLLARLLRKPAAA